MRSKNNSNTINEYLLYLFITICIILGIVIVFYVYKILFTTIYKKSIFYINNLSKKKNNIIKNNITENNIKENFITICISFNFNKDKNKERNEKNEKLLTTLTEDNYNEIRYSSEYKDFFNFYKSLCNKYNFLRDDKRYTNEIKSILQLDLNRNITEDIFNGYYEFYDWIISISLLKRYNIYLDSIKRSNHKLKFKDIPRIEIYKYIKLNQDTNQEENVIDFYITNKMKSLNLIIFNDYIEYLEKRRYNNDINNEFQVEYNLENVGVSTNLKKDIETYKIKDFIKYVLDNQQIILRNTRCLTNINQYMNDYEDTLHPSNAFKIYFNNLHILNCYDVILNSINLTENKEFIYNSIYSGNKHIYYDNKTKQN
jgi:hypothetical protein